MARLRMLVSKLNFTCRLAVYVVIVAAVSCIVVCSSWYALLIVTFWAPGVVADLMYF